MSEYQFLHFMAIDKPLDEKQLAFMHKQSTRAEITPWEFTNEYHFGDFRGNAQEMLRRGYDVHLHYANFGMRRLMIRLPAGLPCDQGTFEKLLPENGVDWLADKTGKGGLLAVNPEGDADAFSEDIYEPAVLLPKIVPVREMLIGGDLRAFYVAWLACEQDEEAMEPPVPAGLDEPGGALAAMAEFYEVSDDLLAAAAERSPAAPEQSDAGRGLEEWLQRQSADNLRDLVRRLLAEDRDAARAGTLSQIRDETETPAWPLAEPTRTLGQLREAAERVGQRRQEREQKARDAARRKRLKTLLEHPKETIARVEKLVKDRSTSSYEEAARELVDLREALGPEREAGLVRAAAEKLRRENPKLNRLIAALRKHGLLD